MAHLAPKNWREFQHYKDRNPPWIRLHRRLLDDREFQRLPLASKALAPMLWLLASESKDGRFDGSVEELAFRLRCGEEDIRAGLAPLLKAGFFVEVHDASSVLAEGEQVAPESCSETEAETEAETELAPIGACPPAANDVPKRYEVPDCPHVQVVALYHEHCPTLPRCEVLNDSRRGMLRQRWREVCTTEKYDAQQALEWWADFFRFVSESNFLTGRAKPRPGGEPFLADFEWLIGPKNFAKVIERRYHRKAA